MTEAPVAKIKAFIANPKVRSIAKLAGVFIAGMTCGVGGMLAKDRLTR
jgi:hypothetical protein